MVFKKKIIEETVEEIPEVESPSAEEIVSEEEIVEAEEPEEPEETKNKSVEQELFDSVLSLNERVLKIESILFRNLN